MRRWGKKRMNESLLKYIISDSLGKKPHCQGSSISKFWDTFFFTHMTCQDKIELKGHLRGPWTWLTELDGHHKTWGGAIAHFWDILSHCSGKYELEIEKFTHVLLSGCLEGINVKNHGWGPRSRPALQKETSFACPFSACPPPLNTQGSKMLICMYVIEQPWICIRQASVWSLPSFFLTSPASASCVIKWGQWWRPLKIPVKV